MKFACCNLTKSGAQNETITCSKCKGVYHITCLDLTNKQKDSSKIIKKKSWICLQCCRLKQSDYIGSPSRTAIKAAVKTTTVCMDTPSLLADVSASDPLVTFSLEQVQSIIVSEISNLKKSLEERITNEIKTLRDEISSLNDSVSFFSSKFEELNVRVEKCESIVTDLMKNTAEVSQIKASVSNLQFESNNREQWARRSNMEIYGIPESNNENLMELFRKIVNLTTLQLNPASDIDFITRVAAKNTEIRRPKPIIVRFIARWKKDEFLTNLKKLKLKCNDIGFVGNNNAIYFNEHLTSENKALLQSAKKLAREKKYMYVWVKNCTIMVRRSENSPVIHVLNQNDLKKIA